MILRVKNYLEKYVKLDWTKVKSINVYDVVKQNNKFYLQRTNCSFFPTSLLLVTFQYIFPF